MSQRTSPHSSKQSCGLEAIWWSPDPCGLSQQGGLPPPGVRGKRTTNSAGTCAQPQG